MTALGLRDLEGGKELVAVDELRLFVSWRSRRRLGSGWRHCRLCHFLVGERVEDKGCGVQGPLIAGKDVAFNARGGHLL